VNVQAVDTLDHLHLASPAATSPTDNIDSSHDSDSDGAGRLQLAVHTVDELLGNVNDDSSPAVAMVMAPRSILSITPRSLAATPRSSRSRVRLKVTSSSPSPTEIASRSRSASPVLTARSVTSICEESIQTVDSDIASQLTHRSRSGRRSSEGQGSARSRRMSEVMTYSEDFTSAAASRKSSLASAGVSASLRRNSRSRRKSSGRSSVVYSGGGGGSSRSSDAETSVSSASTDDRRQRPRYSTSLNKHSRFNNNIYNIPTISICLCIFM